MALADALSHIDSEIASYEEKIRGLQHARTVLSGGSSPVAAKSAAVKTGRRGRPKGSKNTPAAKKAAAPVATGGKPKRKLSPEGRKAIAEAMKRRWAERRSAAGK